MKITNLSVLNITRYSQVDQQEKSLPPVWLIIEIKGLQLPYVRVYTLVSPGFETLSGARSGSTICPGFFYILAQLKIHVKNYYNLIVN